MNFPYIWQVILLIKSFSIPSSTKTRFFKVCISVRTSFKNKGCILFSIGCQRLHHPRSLVITRIHFVARTNVKHIPYSLTISNIKPWPCTLFEKHLHDDYRAFRFGEVGSIFELDREFFNYLVFMVVFTRNNPYNCKQNIFV